MKRTWFLYLVTFCVLMGLAACGSTRGNTSKGPTPTHVPEIIITRQPASPVNASVTQTLQHIATLYYSVIQAKNYPQAYSYLDASATDANGQAITLSSFEGIAQAMDTQEGSVVNFTTAPYPPHVIMTITRSQMGPYHAHLLMKQEGSTWKITSLDRI